jgi:nucleoid-associated protein YgaU
MEGRTYVVRDGDTLEGIARTVYGDPTLWRRLYEANRDAIGPDPAALKVGTKLRVPNRS